MKSKPPREKSRLLIALWLVLSNVELVSGRTDWVNAALDPALPAAFALGVIRTVCLRRNSPDRYAMLTETQVF